MSTMTFSRINLWIDDANGISGWMVRATRTDGVVVEEAIGSLQGEIRGRYDLPRWATEDAADALGLDSLPGPSAWSWTGEVYTIDHSDPVAAIDADLLAAAQECEAATDVYGVTDACDVQSLADKHGVRPSFVVARARALGVPVVG